jgi:2-polyprenyl-3-methyl-5-hydroxy-6-metoxy-1,4-benzoquinol methylase
MADSPKLPTSAKIRQGEGARAARRAGDLRPIDGGYQHRALYSRSAVQRFWHHSKLALLDWLFPVRSGERVLDVGCGSGVFADAMARRGASVVGVDGNPQAVAYAQRTFARPGLSFYRGLVDDLELPLAGFDKAICLEVIEHVHLEQAYTLLAAVHKLLRPGGELLLTTPNYRGFWPLIEWSADRLSSVTGVAKMGGDQHVSRFHRGLLRRALGQSGFDVVELRTYCTFAPFSAAVAWRLANRLERLERHVDLAFGNLLVAVAKKD